MFEGAIDSYIHIGGRLGVLVEVQCRTDYAARSPIFREVVHDIALQIAASPGVRYIGVTDIPRSVFERELKIELGRDDLQGRPATVREAIARQRTDRLLRERVLLESPFVRDPQITVGERLAQAASALGEEVRVMRFVRCVVGGGGTWACSRRDPREPTDDEPPGVLPHHPHSPGGPPILDAEATPG
jgi:elongation factor Ts